MGEKIYGFHAIEEALKKAAETFGISLLDHVIIAGRSAVSMRENGFVPTALWASQHPQTALLRNWLCPVEAPAKDASPKE